jgi:hypothetical protein
MFLSSLSEKPIARRTVASPKTKAVRGNVRDPISGSEKPLTIIIAAPTDAPDETPSVYDDASGFCSTLCITVPLTESAAPTRNAVSTRGTLISQKIETVLGFYAIRKTHAE